MSRCGRQGWCHCGDDRCAAAEWWINWGLLWRCLAYEFELQTDALRYYSELITQAHLD